MLTNLNFITHISSLDFNKETEDAIDTLRGTIFDRFNSVIFDLDNNIWSCTTSSGEGMGAYETTPPYKFEDKNTIKDIKGNLIVLQDGVREVLNLLDLCNKNLGIVSSGEKLADVEKRVSVPFSAQPSTMLLKKFDIFKYFNLYIIYKAFVDKSEFVTASGKTLYVDDRKDVIDSVNSKGDVDVLWRQSFVNWKDLLEKYYE